MSDTAQELSRLKKTKGSQLINEAWDLMHIMLGIQQQQDWKIRRFSYSYIKDRK